LIRVAVSGAGGKLAGPIIKAVGLADDLELTGLYNPKRAGESIEGAQVSSDPAGISADVIVETAHPDVVFDNIAAWKPKGVSLVIGTSGFTPERLEQLRGVWGQATPCLVVPNFAIGAVLMMRYAAEAAAKFEAVEVIERHHSTKPDSPSGTALATAIGVAGGGGMSSPTTGEMVAGARGGLVDGVRVHSLRLPGLISHQEVVMSNPGELFSITHMSTSYDSFAAGALLAIRRIGGLSPGVHLGLDTVL
jgi:4-hydroxy-tetrahydrodipicolinate reductase